MLNIEEQKIVDQAIRIIESKTINVSFIASDFKTICDYLFLKLGLEERENFSVMFLNSRKELIKFETLFKGTLDDCGSYPREIVKRSLQLNAASVIFASNKPGCDLNNFTMKKDTISRSVDALKMMDIETVDYVMVNDQGATSLREENLFLV